MLLLGKGLRPLPRPLPRPRLRSASQVTVELWFTAAIVNFERCTAVFTAAIDLSIIGNDVLACLLVGIPVQGDTALLLCLCLLRSTACKLFFNYLCDISVTYTLYYSHLLPID